MARREHLRLQEKADRRCHQVFVLCLFCGYEYPESLGRYGCPNCHGEGLENKIQKGLLFSCGWNKKGLLSPRNENEPTHQPAPPSQPLQDSSPDRTRKRPVWMRRIHIIRIHPAFRRNRGTRQKPRFQLEAVRQMKTESIRLSDERRAALETVAARCGVANQRGTEAGKPSWRALVYAIADGAVKCTPTKKLRK